MGCHTEGSLQQQYDPQEKVAFIREAYAADESIPWRRVHKLPDYVGNFPHHMHVRAGVSCFSCHGQIRGMPVVYQDQGLGMGWCLDCHRNVEDNIVGPSKVTDLVWAEQHLKERAAGADNATAEARQIIQSLQESVAGGSDQEIGPGDGRVGTSPCQRFLESRGSRMAHYLQLRVAVHVMYLHVHVYFL